MRARFMMLVVLVLGAVSATCIFPTEQDGAVYVTIDSVTAGSMVRKPSSTAPLVLSRGVEADAYATARHKVGTGAQVIPNVVFVWSVADTTKARIDPSTGQIVTVNPGVTTITVAAATYDKLASAGTTSIRVAAPVEIDSIRPRSVKFGDTLTVYGVGTDSIVVAELSGVQLIAFPFSASRDSLGYGRQAFWVPPPATTDSLFYIGNDAVGYALNDDTTRVVQEDLYDPNSTSPATLNLNGPRPIPQEPETLFYNPALSFGKLARTQTFGGDWYHLLLKTGDYTLVLHSRASGGKVQPYITDSLGYDTATDNYIIGHDSWTEGPESHDCHGLTFSPPETLSESTVVALKGYPNGDLDWVAVYTATGPYTLSVTNGLVETVNGVGFDSNEEDGNCSAADTTYSRAPLSPPFRDTLTMAVPHAIDWIRFHQASAGLVQFQLTTLPSPTPDSAKDLDLYLVTVPAPTATALVAVAVDTSGTLNVNQTLTLAAGDYYVVVLDYAGTVTPYELCVGGCAVFPTAGVRAAHRRHTMREPRRPLSAPPPE